jgi:hypothetical protein
MDLKKRKLLIYIIIFILVIFAFLLVLKIISFKNTKSIVNQNPTININNQNLNNETKKEISQDNHDNSWQTFNEDGFSISIPNNWKKEYNKRFVSNENKLYYLNFSSLNIEQIKDEARKRLLNQGKIKEAEELYFQNLCKETESCGKIIQFKKLEIDNSAGAEFIVSYSGLSREEKRGTRSEIYRAIMKNEKVYIFWTQDKNVPQELLDQYPRLDPTPTEIFYEIMETLKIN